MVGSINRLFRYKRARSRSSSRRLAVTILGTHQSRSSKFRRDYTNARHDHQPFPSIVGLIAPSPTSCVNKYRRETFQLRRLTRQSKTGFMLTACGNDSSHARFEAAIASKKTSWAVSAAPQASFRNRGADSPCLSCIFRHPSFTALNGSGETSRIKNFVPEPCPQILGIPWG
jgi:hypothetical protein